MNSAEDVLLEELRNVAQMTTQLLSNLASAACMQLLLVGQRSLLQKYAIAPSSLAVPLGLLQAVVLSDQNLQECTCGSLKLACSRAMGFL